MIRRIKRTGRYNRERARPLSVEFVHHEDVSYIMENKNDLGEGIYVNREYSPEVERKWRILLPILRAAKYLDGYKKQVRLENEKIVIKGKDYDMKNIHELPEELNAFKVTSKENESVVGFFGELNPLSNFFPALFVVDGQSYISNEQYIQAVKAKYFGDNDVYNQIMGCKTSSDCKEFSRKIKGVDYSKWETVAADICRNGIREKFIQNPILMETLVHRTGSKHIIECTKDRLWGTGTALAHPDCLNSDRWITSGIMGKILEDIGLEFCSHYPAPAPVTVTTPVTFHHSSTTIGVSGLQQSASVNAEPHNLHPSMFHPPVPLVSSDIPLSSSTAHPTMMDMGDTASESNSVELDHGNQDVSNKHTDGSFRSTIYRPRHYSNSIHITVYAEQY